MGLPYWNPLDPNLATNGAIMIPELVATGCPQRSLAQVVLELAASREDADAVLEFISEEAILLDSDYERVNDRLNALHDLSRCWMIASGYAPTTLSGAFSGTIITLASGKTVALSSCPAFDFRCPENTTYVYDGLADDTPLMANLHVYIDVGSCPAPLIFYRDLIPMCSCLAAAHLEAYPEVSRVRLPRQAHFEKWMLLHGRETACQAAADGRPQDCMPHDPFRSFGISAQDACEHPAALGYFYDFQAEPTGDNKPPGECGATPVPPTLDVHLEAGGCGSSNQRPRTSCAWLTAPPNTRSSVTHVTSLLNP